MAEYPPSELPPEQPGEPDQPLNMEFAPANPHDSEARDGVAEQLVAWKALQAQEQQAPEVGAGEDQPKHPPTLEERLQRQRDLYEARLNNSLEGLAGQSASEEVSRRYGVPTGRELLQQYIANVDSALERSTPDEQEDLLIMENHDWRAWLTKHSEGDQQRHIGDLRRFRASMRTLADQAEYAESTSFRLSDIPPELTLEEEQRDYWRWLAASFAMSADDLSEGVSKGLITDLVALQVLGEYGLREARDKYNYEAIGPDTEEQGEISLRAYEAFKATEKQLEPVLKGTRAEQAAFCVWMAERVTAEAVVFCVQMDEQATAEAVANWHKMAARVAGSAI